MAYKFQLGEAKLSGSITQTDGTFIEAQTQLRIGSAQITEAELGLIDGITAGTAAASKALVLDGSSDIAGIGALGATSLSASADLEVGGNITGSGVSLSDASGIVGDGLTANGGVIDLDIPSLAADMTGDVADTDELAISDGGTMKKVDFSVVRDAVFNDVSGDATIAAGGALTIAAGAVENGMLSGSIAAGKLNLGNGFQDTAGNLTFDLQPTNPGLFVDGDGLGLKATIGGDKTFSGNVTVSGDLNVAGTLNRVTETELLIEDVKIILASGSTAFATGQGFEIGDGTDALGSILTNTIDFGMGDVNLFDISLAVSASQVYTGLVASPSVVIGNSEWDISTSHISGNLPVYASAFHGDGSNLTGISADTATALTMAVVSKADGNSLEEDKVNYFATLSADATVSLPASNGDLIGKSLYIKLGNLTNDAVVTVNTNGASQKIDGADSILLESAYAAVRLVYVASDDWRVF